MSSAEGDENSAKPRWVAKLERKLQRTMDDQLFIIEQQRDRIDHQQHQLDDQRILIEELTWQLHELNESIKKCNANVLILLQGKSSAATSTAQKRSVKSGKRSESKTTRQTNYVAETIIRESTSESIASSHVERYEAIKQPIEAKQIQHRSDAYTFLSKHIPPPPNSSPPHDNDDDNDGPNNDGNDDFGPLEISRETLAKLNQLYEMRRYVRNSNIDLNDFNDFLSHRMKKFNEYSTQMLQKSNANTFGSSYLSSTLHRLDEVDDEKDIENEKNQSNCFDCKENQSMKARVTKTTHDRNDEMFI